MEKENKIIEYFMGNIFEAKSYYIQWKMILGARSPDIVGEDMSKKYISIQNKYAGFFMTAERASLIAFVTLICHNFDDSFNKDNMRLGEIDEVEYLKFKTENQDVIEKLKKVRHKLFAHKSKTVDPKDLPIPSILDLDNFFTKLEDFFNILNSKIRDAHTMFINADNIKDEIEALYMTIYTWKNTDDKEMLARAEWRNYLNKISKKI